MATLPSLGSNNNVSVLITTTAEDGALKTTQAELQVLGDEAKNAGSKAKSGLEQFSSNLKSVGKQMTSMGHSMTTYLTLPIIGAGIAAAKMSSDFQTQMELIRTQAGDTTDSISKLSQQVLDMAKTSQFGPSELAQGLYYVTSFGYRGAAAMQNLKAMADLATIGQANLADTTRAVNAAMATGINGTQNLQETIGTLNAIVGVGAMRMNDLVAAMGTGFIEQAKLAGLSLSDVGAALATMTDTGQNADTAATHIRMALALIEGPSKAAQKALASIGLTSTTLAEDMRSKGIIYALQDLQKHLIDTYGTTDQGKNKIAAALTGMFGGGRSSSGVETMLDQISRIQQKSLSTAQAGNQVAASLKEMQNTPGFQMKESWSKLQVALIELGDHILPIVVPAISHLVDFVDNLASRFDKLSKPLQTAVLAFLGIAAVAGPLLIFIGTLATAIGTIAALSGPVLIVLGVIGGLALLAPVVIAYWTPISNFFLQIFNSIKNGVDDLRNHFWYRLGEIVGFIATFPYTWPVYVAEAVSRMVAALNINWYAVFSTITSALIYAFNAALNYVEHINWGGIAANYAKGVLSAEFNSAKGIVAGLFGGHATGTNYARGGWSWVGENGPEMMYVPRGSQIRTNSQSGMTDNSRKTSVTIGTIVLPGVHNASDFIRELNQDTINIGRGLTTNQGVHA